MASAIIAQNLIASVLKLPCLCDDDEPRDDLLLWSNPRTGLSCHYAPFEYVNKNAKLILVGITPGGTQMNRALNAARIALLAGVPIDEAVRRVKREGSFGGAMRLNIVATLNRLGYQQQLGISCVSQLWGNSDHLVQFSSLLKFPVFLNGNDYNGKPSPLKDAELRTMLLEHFIPDLQKVRHDALLVPLGNTVMETVMALKQQGRVPQKVMMFEGRPVAPPHPSGANAESISLLLEESYPSQAEYERRMYGDYLARAPWERKAGQPQPEAKYRSARASRWQAMEFVRRAYGIR